MRQPNEKRRNILWRSAITISTILIVIIFVFVLQRLFLSNPLAGQWSYMSGNLTMKIETDEKVVFLWKDKETKEEVSFDVPYKLDRKEKTITFSPENKGLEELPGFSEESVNVVDVETNEQKNKNADYEKKASYIYSVENNQLTLTGREYGEQLIFKKK